MTVSGYPPNADGILPGLSSWMESVRSTLDTVAGVATGPQILSLQIVQEEDGDVRGVANVTTETVNVRFKADVTDWPTEAEIAAATPVTTSGQTKVTSGVLATLTPGQEVYLGAIAYAADASFSLAFFTRGIPTGVFGAPTLQLTTSETATLGTLTVVLNDPNSLVTKVEFRSKQGDSAWSVYNEDASPPYSADVTMIEGEISRIGTRITYTDKTGSSVFLEDEVEFRTDPTAVVSVPNVTVEGTNGRIDYSGNHYTASIWRKDRGAAFGTATQIDTGRVATETIALTGSRQDYDAFGKNAAAVAGPVVEFSLPPQQQWGNLANRLLDAVTGGTLQAGLIQDSAGATGIRVDRDDTLPGGWVQYIDLGAISSEPILYFPGFEILASGETIIKDWSPVNLLEPNDAQGPQSSSTHYDYKQFDEATYGKLLVDLGLKVGDTISFGGEARSTAGTDDVYFRLRFWDSGPSIVSTHDTPVVNSATYTETKIEKLVIPATTESITFRGFHTGTADALHYWQNARLAYAANLPEWQQPPITGGSEDIINSIMIVAEAIEAGHIAANTITGTHIDSDTITADNIDADTITATEIAGLTITGAELAAGAITAGKISAAAIDATNLFVDGIITAGKLLVSQLSTITANVGLVTAGVIRDFDSKMIIDLDNKVIVINDDQTVPVNRVQIGKFGTLQDEYGLELYDASGTLILGGSGTTGGGMRYPSGLTVNELEPAEADADQTSIHTALNTLNVASRVAVDVDDATGRVLYALDVVGDLNPGVFKSDGTEKRVIVTDGQSGGSNDGDAISFEPSFQDIPVILFNGGGVIDAGTTVAGTAAFLDSWMGLSPPAVEQSGFILNDVTEEIQAEALTTSGFNLRAKILERNFSVAENNDNFGAGTATTEGASVALGGLAAASETGSYRVQYDITLNVDSEDNLTTVDDDLTGTLTAQGQSSQVTLSQDPNGNVTVDYDYDIRVTADAGGSSQQDNFSSGLLEGVDQNEIATLSQSPSGNVTVHWTRVCQAVCGSDGNLDAASSIISVRVDKDLDGVSGWTTHTTKNYGTSICVCEGAPNSETDNGPDSVSISGFSSGGKVRLYCTIYTESSGGTCAVATTYADPLYIEYNTGVSATNEVTVKTYKDVGAGWQQTDSNFHTVTDTNSVEDQITGNMNDVISGMDQSESVKVEIDSVNHIGDGTFSQTITPGDASYSAGSAETATLTVKVAIDSKDGAAAWVERVTKSYVLTDSSGTGTNNTWSNEVLNFIDNDLIATDDIRVRLKEVTVTGLADSNSQTLDPDHVTVDDITGTVTESSKTPLGSDIIQWTAIGANV